MDKNEIKKLKKQLARDDKKLYKKLVKFAAMNMEIWNEKTRLNEVREQLENAQINLDKTKKTSKIAP